MLAIKFTVILNVLTVVVLGYDRAQKTSENSRLVFPSELFIRTNQHHHHHPSNDYLPTSHNNGDIPGRRQESDRDDRYQDKSKEGADPAKGIPLDFAKHINDFNVSDLLLNYVEGEDDYEEPLLLNRFAGASNNEMERNAQVKMPETARCMPEFKAVEIAPMNTEFFYIPQCTRVERCGGCCTHKLLSCQPVETETISYKLLKTQYVEAADGSKKFKYIGKELIPVEKHTKCKCGCKLKAENCNKYQEYREAQCSCICTNNDEMRKCNREYSKKVWNPDLCVCQCREILPCTTGYRFDLNECRCMAAPVRRRYAVNEQASYAYDDSDDLIPFEGLPEIN